MLKRLTWPKWASRQHPLVRYELHHWERARAWAWVKRGMWSGAVVLLLLPFSCALIFGVTASYTSPSEVVVSFGGVIAVGAFMLSGVAEAFVSLVANIIGATLIAREREGQTWAFLRLTLLTDAELVGGKLMALFYILRQPLALVYALRGLALLSVLVTLGVLWALNPAVVATVWQGVVAALPQLWATSPVEVVLFLGSAGLSLGLALFTLLFSPVFNLFYNGLVSLLVSALVRARSGAIVVTFGLHFTLGLALYFPAQQVTSIFLAFGLNPSISPVTTNSVFGPVVVLLTPTFAQGVQYVLMLGVMVLAYYGAVRRVRWLAE